MGFKAGTEIRSHFGMNWNNGSQCRSRGANSNNSALNLNANNAGRGVTETQGPTLRLSVSAWLHCSRIHDRVSPRVSRETGSPGRLFFETTRGSLAARHSAGKHRACVSASKERKDLATHRPGGREGQRQRLAACTSVAGGSHLYHGGVSYARGLGAEASTHIRPSVQSRSHRTTRDHGRRCSNLGRHVRHGVPCLPSRIRAAFSISEDSGIRSTIPIRTARGYQEVLSVDQPGDSHADH